jgi:uncharacterized protein (TIGR03435 family)
MKNARTVCRAFLFTAAGLITVGGLNAPELRSQSLSQPPGEGGPRVEAATIKLNTTGRARITFGIQPDGRFTATNIPLRDLIRIAYGFQNFQIVGGPDWIQRDRFDIVATAVEPSSRLRGRPPIQMVARALLAERFQLKTHLETRELSGYALVVATTDGRLGPQIRPADADCSRPRPAAPAAGGPAPQGSPTAPRPLPRPTCGIRYSTDAIAAGATTLSQLATTLARSLDTFVMDRTDVNGVFDFDLRWTADGSSPAAPADSTAGSSVAAPSIFQAVEEQLGLKLVTQWGPVNMLVIDSAERPHH